MYKNFSVALLGDIYEVLGFITNFHSMPSSQAALAAAIIFQIISV